MMHVIAGRTKKMLAHGTLQIRIAAKAAGV
jgi:hypothetical protein